ncbi:MAG: hypothetical protein WEA29_09730 [Acidimicrobiia bacterium]
MSSTLSPGKLRLINVLRHGVSVAWGAVTGVAPHVLHHVGPLAGAALLAGATGRILFFLLGLLAATPMLIRLYRRFRTWVAPAVAVVIFAVAYTLSSLLLGPWLTGGANAADEFGVTTTTDPHGH